jgi:alkanesulfonate monooxygenase SsuD/methylene tetrahydromethanopterin reductase-like flavin-dependent oxidoreductase (luciferase family)
MQAGAGAAFSACSIAGHLNEQSNGRFLLGIGVSHAPTVSTLRGHLYGKPVATMRAYLDAMRSATYSAPPPMSHLPR